LTYRLYRLAAPCDDPIDGDLLGVFPDFEAALDARDDDAVTLLADSGARPILACHTIVGPGAGGETTAHPVISSLGESGQSVDVEGVLAETRDWLRRVHSSGGGG
jgi:hypothetical protein